MMINYINHNPFTIFMNHIMIDGIDSSGKGIATNAAKEFLHKKGLKVLDLRDHWKDHDDYPNITDYDAIITTEPTFSSYGKKIRFEMINNKTAHTPKEIATAFSKDRKEMYEKVVIPAKKANKIIVQERGVISSLVYQPLMEGTDRDFVLNLEGNQFCLNNSPDLLIITTVDPEESIKRLGTRKKKDDAIFEKQSFLQKCQEVYKSDWIKQIYESNGTKIIFLDTNPPKTPEDTKEAIHKILDKGFN